MDKGKRFSVQVLLFMASCMLEGYFFMEYRMMPIVLGVGAVLVLAATYVLANTLWSEYEKQQELKRQEQQPQENEQMEEHWKEIEKIQKAMYVATKRYADDVKKGIDEIKAELEEGRNFSKQQAEEVLKSGEGVVKLLIRYNRLDAQKIAGFHKKQYQTITKTVVEAIENSTETFKQDLEKNMAAMKTAKSETSFVAEEPTSIPEPKPIIEEPAPIPEPEDPNKMMSPEDIAALIAATNAPSEPEAAAEPEPIIEEPAPIPEAEDPNKMMSPEDIAALLASMNS